MASVPRLAPSCFEDAPLAAQDVARGVTRLFFRQDLFAMCEVPLPNGRRADMMAICGKGLLTELLTFLQGSAQYATLLAATRPIILGLVLILIMRFRPTGLVPERRSFRGESRRGAGGPPQLREDEVPQTAGLAP
jgi:hypothetical protein